jgi:hypothetical protein
LSNTAAQPIQVVVFWSITDFNDEWVFKLRIFVSWVQKSLNLISKFSAKESIISAAWKIGKGTLNDQSL